MTIKLINLDPGDVKEVSIRIVGTKKTENENNKKRTVEDNCLLTDKI